MNMIDNLIIGCFLGLVAIVVVNSFTQALEREMFAAYDKRSKKLNNIWCFVREYVSVVGINTITDSVTEACRYILHLLYAKQTRDEFATSSFTACLSFAEAEPTDDQLVIMQKIVIAVNKHLRSRLPEHHREKLDQFLTNDDSSKAMREDMRKFIESAKRNGSQKTRFIL